MHDIHWASRVRRVGARDAGPRNREGAVTSAAGSGLRLLPLVGGLIAGAVPADRIAALAGAKVVVAAGFILFAGGLLLGATTSAFLPNTETPRDQAHPPAAKTPELTRR